MGGQNLGMSETNVEISGQGSTSTNLPMEWTMTESIGAQDQCSALTSHSPCLNLIVGVLSKRATAITPPDTALEDSLLIR